MKLDWQISAIQMGGRTGALAASLPHHFVYVARPRLVLVLLDDEPGDDEGGNIMAAASEKDYRAMLHRDGMNYAKSRAHVWAMPRFYRLGFWQGIESRQTSYEPGTGFGAVLADRLMLSASGMLKLFVIFAHHSPESATAWKILSKFLDGQDRADAARFLENVVAVHHGKPVGSMVRFTLPEITRFDPAALAMMGRFE